MPKLFWVVLLSWLLQCPSHPALAAIKAVSTGIGYAKTFSQLAPEVWKVIQATPSVFQQFVEQTKPTRDGSWEDFNSWVSTYVHGEACGLYDIVIDVMSVRALAFGSSWHVHFPNPAVTLGTFLNPTEAELKALGHEESSDWSPPRVGIFGEFNRGKTTVINMLANQQFQTGLLTHTPGLSLKRIGLDYVVIDSAGSSIPVLPLQDHLRDRLATDALVQDVIFDLSDLVLVVVNQLSLEDEKLITGIRRRLEERLKVVHPNNAADEAFIAEKVRARMMIVHNFKDITNEKDLNTVINNDIRYIYGAKLKQIGRYNIFYSDKYIHFALMSHATDEGRNRNRKEIEKLNHVVTHAAFSSKPLNQMWNDTLAALQRGFNSYASPVSSPNTVSETPKEGNLVQDLVHLLIKTFRGANPQQPVPGGVQAGFATDMVLHYETSTQIPECPTNDTNYPYECAQSPPFFRPTRLIAKQNNSLLVPGSVDINPFLEFNSGVTGLNFGNLFVPPLSIFVHENRTEAVIKLELAGDIEDMKCDFAARKVVIRGVKKRNWFGLSPPYELVHDERKSGKFAVSALMPFFIAIDSDCGPLENGIFTVSMKAYGPLPAETVDMLYEIQKAKEEERTKAEQRSQEQRKQAAEEEERKKAEESNKSEVDTQTKADLRL